MDKFANLEVLFKMGDNGCKYYGRQTDHEKDGNNYLEVKHEAYDFANFK